MTPTFPATALVLLLATALTAPSPGQVPIRTPLVHPAGARVVELLRGSRGDDAPPEAETVALLRAEVEDGLEVVGQILVAGRLPAFVEGEEHQVLSDPQRALLAQALESLPGETLRTHATAIEAAHPEAEGSAAALFLWSLCAEPNDLAHLAGLAVPSPAPTDGNEVELEYDERLLEAFETATTALVERDAATLDEIGHLARVCDEALLPAVVRAMGRGGRPEALRLILDLARNHPELDALAIAQVRKLGGTSDVGLNEAWAVFLRDRLDPEQSAACRVAVLAVGTVRDFDAIPKLLDYLESDGGIAHDACSALREMTGLQLAEDSIRWRRWFEAEQAWFANDFPDRRVDMRSKDLGLAVSAVRDVATHRYRRDEIAEELVKLLDEQHTQLDAVVCSALATLASPRALPALVGLLELPEGPTRDAAQAALVAITGRADVPADADRWRAELGL